jgi:hypothetical protein
VALVLAIDRDDASGQTLERLTQELADHEILVAASYDEAVAVIDRHVPDLIVFPLFVSPSDEAVLRSRLRGVSPGDRVQTLTIPLIASESAAGSEHGDLADTRLRWFYWFRPRDASGKAIGIDSHAFAKEIRSQLERERAARLTLPAPATPLTVKATPVPYEPLPAPVPIAPTPTRISGFTPAPQERVIPSPPVASPSSVLFAHSVEADEPGTFGIDASGDSTQQDISLPEPQFSIAERTSPLQGALNGAKAVSRLGFRSAKAGFGLAATAVRTTARLVGRARSAERPEWLQISAYPRWLRYSTPALILAVGVTFTVGLPTRVPRMPMPRVPWMTPPQPQTGIAELQSVPDGSEVVVDGQKIGVTPLSATLAAGIHQVEFRYRGVARTVPIEITAGQSSELKVDWKKQPTARLTVTSEPTGATVTVDGKQRGVTPLTMDDLAIGSHLVLFEHAAGSVQRTVKLKANESATLNVSVYSGWLTLFAPVELQISEDGQKLTLDDHNRVMLSSGRHELQLVNRELGYRGTQVIEVQPGEMTVTTVVLPKTKVTITATPGAEVWIDGVKAGETPLADVPIDLGTRQFLFKNPTLGERTVTATATVKPLRVNVDFSKPEA